jgi:hypothetical protein
MAEVTSGMGSQGQGLAKLREAFPPNQISQRAQSRGGPMLSYVGHAALTDRLLDADPMWNWEPLAFGPEGLPVLDTLGGMWIRLTVCGVTRLGYGDAGEKIGPNAIKEVIGDALRNAAMRFGAALELWHKGELHVEPKPDIKNVTGTVGAVIAMTPAADLTDDEKIADREYYETLAHEVTQTYNNLGPVKALHRVDLENLDNDQTVKLWNFLDSKVRSGLKQAGDLKRAEKAKA